MIGTTILCKIASIPVPTLHLWAATGMVTPISSGSKGRNESKQFSVQQAIGVVVSGRLRDSCRGASHNYLREVIKGFSLMTEKRLQSLFIADRTHFSEAFDKDGTPLMDLSEVGERHGRVDVKEVYEAILKEMSVAK